MIAMLNKIIWDITTARAEVRFHGFQMGADAYREFKQEIEDQTAVRVLGAFAYQGVPVDLVPGFPPNAVRAIVEYCIK